jgi:hypothetical protein
MKLLIMQPSPASCQLIPLRTKYPPQHPVLKHPQSIFFPQCQRQSFIPIQKRTLWPATCKFNLLDLILKVFYVRWIFHVFCLTTPQNSKREWSLTHRSPLVIKRNECSFTAAAQDVLLDSGKTIPSATGAWDLQASHITVSSKLSSRHQRFCLVLLRSGVCLVQIKKKGTSFCHYAFCCAIFL